MKLSIVSTLFKSSEHLHEFHQKCEEVAIILCDDNYEIILVNDGLQDDSLKVAKNIALGHSNVTLIDLSRNFGHHKAMMAGLSYSSGDLVFLIDSDLEEDPIWLLEFHKAIQKDSSDVVFGVQTQRKGALFERFSGGIFWWVVRKISGLEITSNQVTARLMTRRYVNALLKHPEKNIFIGGLFFITGFKQSKLSVSKKASSPTSYSFAKKCDQLITAITSFTAVPLNFIFYSGCVILIVSSAMGIAHILNYVFFNDPPAGYTTLIISLWLIGGLLAFSIGLIGIYISQIFTEVKNRPNTIVREIIKSKSKKNDGLE